MKNPSKIKRLRLTANSGGGGNVELEAIVPAGELWIIRNINIKHTDSTSKDVTVNIRVLPTDPIEELIQGATVAPNVWNYPGMTTSTLSVTSVEYQSPQGKAVKFGEEVYALVQAMTAGRAVFMNIEYERIIVFDGIYTRLP